MQGKFSGNSSINAMLPRPSGAQLTSMKETPAKVLQERPSAANGTGHDHAASSVNASAPAAK